MVERPRQMVRLARVAGVVAVAQVAGQRQPLTAEQLRQRVAVVEEVAEAAQTQSLLA